MSDLLTGLDSPASADALEVARVLRAAGHVAYLAGGCVRDLLLGLVPKDFDVATDAPPDRVRGLFKRTQAVGAAFGVVLVRLTGQTEVATFRTDGTYLDGRRPESVTFTTAEHDAQRRDFTINGLFYDPVERRVVDYVGGQADLRAGLIRAIGDPAARFEEDHLRLLRAVRFCNRFQFTIDPATFAAMRAHAPQLKRIAPQRIGEELRRILSGPRLNTGYRLLTTAGLDEPIFGSATTTVAPSEGLLEARDLVARLPALAPPHDAPAAFAAAAVSFAWARSGDPGAPLPLLVPAAARTMIDALRTAVELSNVERDLAFGALAAAHALLTESTSVAGCKRFLAGPNAVGATAILGALANAPVMPDLNAQALAVLADLDALRGTDFAAAPLVTGDDLRAAGLQPGPAFKKILDRVYDAQLEGVVTTKKDSLALALQLSTNSSDSNIFPHRTSEKTSR